MRTPEEFLKSKLSVTNWNFLNHVLHSGEVYKQILSAMNEYGNQQYNQAIEDAAENCESCQLTDVHGVGIGEFVSMTDSESILKLKKTVICGG